MQLGNGSRGENEGGDEGPASKVREGVVLKLLCEEKEQREG